MLIIMQCSSHTHTHVPLLSAVCENCYEMSGLMATGVILGDLLLTGAVILIVYMCVRKNTGSTQHKGTTHTHTHTWGSQWGPKSSVWLAQFFRMSSCVFN